MWAGAVVDVVDPQVRADEWSPQDGGIVDGEHHVVGGGAAEDVVVVVDVVGAQDPVIAGNVFLVVDTDEIDSVPGSVGEPDGAPEQRSAADEDHEFTPARAALAAAWTRPRVR
ncbi:hypothetical protein GCM10020255_028140 [Rhodococcus baikonurensis]